MFDVTGGAGRDGEAEIATLMFECGLAVEAAAKSAKRLKQTPPLLREAGVDRILKLLEQTVEAFQDLQFVVAHRRGDGAQGDLPTASDRDLGEICTAVRRANLPAGGVIREVDLAQRLEKEHGVVREAAIWLESRGVVERMLGSGIRENSFSPADLRDLLEIRETLEPIACAIAATVMTRAEKDELADFLDPEPKGGCGEDQAAPCSEAPASGHDNFCLRIIRGSRKASLIELLCGRTHYRLWYYRRFFRQNPGAIPAVIAERKRILAALLAGDGTLAAAEMRRHLENARARTTWIGAPERRGKVEDLEAYRMSRRTRSPTA